MTRRVLILGATSGIAQEVSRCFAAERAKLFLVARDPEKLKALTDDLKVRGAESVETYAADLTDHSSYPLIISRSLAVWGGLDAALIAHGILPDQLSVESNPALLLNSIEINYISVVSLLMQLAIALESRDPVFLQSLDPWQETADAGVTTFMAVPSQRSRRSLQACGCDSRPRMFRLSSSSQVGSALR